MPGRNHGPRPKSGAPLRKFRAQSWRKKMNEGSDADYYITKRLEQAAAQRLRDQQKCGAKKPVPVNQPPPVTFSERHIGFQLGFPRMKTSWF